VHNGINDNRDSDTIRDASIRTIDDLEDHSITNKKLIDINVDDAERSTNFKK